MSYFEGFPQLPFGKLFIAWTLFVGLLAIGLAAVVFHFVSKYW